MAQYEHLPIYKKAFDLLIYIEKSVSNFSRYHKYSLGSDLRQLARQVVRTIVRANSEADKNGALKYLRNILEEFLICLRLAKELQLFKNLNSYVFAMEMAVQISRQNEGWLKSLKLPEQSH